jgi:hypothetical protein
MLTSFLSINHVVLLTQGAWLALPHDLTPVRQSGYNAGMSDLTSTIASLQRRVEEIAVHL